MNLLFCIFLAFNVSYNFTFVYDSNDGAFIEEKRDFRSENTIISENMVMVQKSSFILIEPGMNIYFGCNDISSYLKLDDSDIVKGLVSID